MKQAARSIATLEAHLERLNTQREKAEQKRNLANTVIDGLDTEITKYQTELDEQQAIQQAKADAERAAVEKALKLEEKAQARAKAAKAKARAEAKAAAAAAAEPEKPKRVFSDEHRAKLSAAATGRLNPTAHNRHHVTTGRVDYSCTHCMLEQSEKRVSNV